MPAQPLLVVGLAAWAGCLLGWASAAAGAALLLQGLGAVLVLTVAGVLICHLDRVRLHRGAAALVAVGLLAGWAAGASYLVASRPAALHQWAEAGSEVVLTGSVVSSTLVQREHQGARDYARAVVTVRAIGPPGRTVAVRGSAVLIGDPMTLGTPERGTHIVVAGRLLPLQAWRDPGATVRVDSVRATTAAGGFHAFVAGARADMWRGLAPIDREAASLVAGLAIGDDSAQSPQLAQAMRDSGLSHLTAVSGGNIAIVAGLVVGAVAAAGGGIRTRIGLAVAVVVGYAAFVGPQPSVLRAAVMGVVALVGLLRTTASGGFPLLGLAVLCLVLALPGLAVSWGFALSVAATGGILVIAPRLQDAVEVRLPRAPPVVVTALAVTLAAQLATAPLIAAMTGTFSLVAVPANLLAAPLVAPITVLGLLLVVAAVAAPPLATPVAYLAEPFGLLLARIAGWASAVPHGSLTVPTGAVGALVVAGALAALWAAWRLSAGDRADPPRRRPT